MISPARISDLWTLRRKPRNLVLLYNEAMLARPHRPAWYTLGSTLRGAGRDGATLVYREGSMRGMIQSRRRKGRPEQDILALAAYGGASKHFTNPDMWYRLLEALVVHAGHHHIQRLFAALPQTHEELREVFRQLGFSCYAQQTVTRLEGPDWDQGTTLAPMRRQTRRDIWAIHKLYGAITPHSVQQAEARDSRSWMLPRSRVQRQRNGWVLGSEDNLTAYLHLTSGPAAHILTLLVQPDARDITTDLLRFGLGQVPDTQPIYLLLRDYQRELLLPAGDLGFQPIGEQGLFCKQTTVPVRRSILAPALEVGRDSRAPIPTTISGRDTRSYVRTT